jgi:hypothetical protein
MKIRRETLKRISGWIQIYVGPVEYEKIVEEETGRSFNSPDNIGVNSSEDILMLLTDLSQSEKEIDHEQLFKVICRCLHPLASKFPDNAELESEKAIRKFNEWLKYDGQRVTKRDNNFVVVPSTDYIVSDDVAIWPDSYHWDEKKNTYQTGRGMIRFGANNSITKTVFGALVEHEGKWVDVKALGKAVDRDSHNMRTVISSIKRKLLNNGLSIKASGTGKYRIIPT